jgi:fructosamine-3-kinase
VTSTFVKRDPAAPAGFFEAEARGMRWLAEAGGVRVATVLAVGPTFIELERLVATQATTAAADAFGSALARTHAAGSDVWGRASGDGFIGPLPLPNGPYGSWADLWWRGRVEPYLRRAVDQGRLSSTDARSVEQVSVRRSSDVPAGSPARVHGDLWAGNVVWTDRGAVLVDAGAAHGGCAEADLAMLALFGLPHLERVLDAYVDSSPLPDGWRERVPLMQLHPLLVHVVLFGGGYVGSLRRAVADLA